MWHKSTLFGLFGGLVIPLLLQANTGFQIAVESKIHGDDYKHFHPTIVHVEENCDEEFHVAGYGSCAYCGCPGFTESYNDSYRCTCGHSWDDHFSSGA